MIGELVVSAGLLKSSSLGRIGKVSVTGIWHFIQGMTLRVPPCPGGVLGVGMLNRFEETRCQTYSN